ncbi:MAG TPA: Si-specific NAD(P)(+) transhydrogenase [Gemmatimonadales bacterium]|nr:Si-specific NAD(P)(+) transhydrogenase [Gemmatimonadales bacterium]
MDSPYDYDFVAIGSGPAGQRGAVQAAKLGRRVALVERRRMMGGVCVDTGTIPSKTFREAVISFVASSRPFGAPPEVRPARRPTAEQLLARVAQVVALECRVIENQLRRNDVEVIAGTASFEDPHTLVVEDESGKRRITAGSILIAVGTQPVPPPGVAHDGTAVFTSDDIVTLRRLPRALTVVGAGVIGTEYASMFAELGVNVTLIEKRPRPLEFLDAEIVDELIHQMRVRNVTFRPNESVERVDVENGTGDAPRVTVTLDSGKRIVSDAVLFSVGRSGATAELNLPAAGLSADERGRLAVDADYRSAVPHIFAAGDVIGYPSLAATSSEQGRLAACAAMGVAAGRVADHFPIGIYAIPEISMVGATEEQLTRDRIPYETGIARYREIARGQILGDDSGLFKMLFHREDRRLLGVHIIGTGATELVHIGQAVLGLGGGLDYFLGTVFNYPTLAECYKVAALNAANKMR